jgi:hypothetical protein
MIVKPNKKFSVRLNGNTAEIQKARLLARARQEHSTAPRRLTSLCSLRIERVKEYRVRCLFSERALSFLIIW